MEDVPAGLGEEVDPVDRLAAAMEDPGTADLLGDLLVHLEEEVAVGLGAAQVTGRVVGPHDRIGAGLELGPRGGDAGRQERVEEAADLVGVEHHVHEERLDPDHLVGHRPGPVDLAHDGHVGVTLAEESDRAADGLQRGPLEVVVGDLDVLGLDDREPRWRGPVVLLGPLGLATEGVRLELGVPDRHDRVHAQDVVRGGGQAGHLLGVEMRFRE